MRIRILVPVFAASMLVLPMMFGGGCDREIEHTKSTKVKSDGTVKEKETTIKETPEGTITKEEKSRTVAPEKP